MKPIVYLLGNASIYDNEEIIFSLRSVEQHLPNRRVIIIGDDNKLFSKEVDFVKFQEAQGNKTYRTYQKIKHACKIIKDDFLCFHDDFFLTQDYTQFAPDGYRWSKGDLFKDGPSRGYSRTLRNTSRYLEENGFTTYNFDIHAPIEYNSEKFIDISNHLDKGKQEFSGMVTASIYGNVYGFKPMPYTDVVLTSLRYTEDFDRMETNQMFSTSNTGFGNGVKEYLEALFPNKSKYEK